MSAKRSPSSRNLLHPHTKGPFLGAFFLPKKIKKTLQKTLALCDSHTIIIIIVTVTANSD